MGEASPPHTGAGEDGGRKKPVSPVRLGVTMLLVMFAVLALGLLVLLVVAPGVADRLALPLALVLELALALLALGCIAAAVYLQARDSETH